MERRFIVESPWVFESWNAQKDQKPLAGSTPDRPAKELCTIVARAAAGATAFFLRAPLGWCNFLT